MSKIIIENRGTLTEVEAVTRALEVIKGGRVSGKSGREQYCYVTTFKDYSVVYAYRNQNSDRLVVSNLIRH